APRWATPSVTPAPTPLTASPSRPSVQPSPPVPLSSPTPIKAAPFLPVTPSPPTPMPATPSPLTPPTADTALPDTHLTTCVQDFLHTDWAAAQLQNPLCAATLRYHALFLPSAPSAHYIDTILPSF
ncbi:unnamed protein product, partial [Pylaiella littoralis]